MSATRMESLTVTAVDPDKDTFEDDKNGGHGGVLDG
jgi:hypothetical protein